MKLKSFLPCAAAIILVLTLSGCPSSFLYYPEKAVRATPAIHGLAYESVSFETEDKVMLTGWWVPARDPLGVVLFCHGNGGNVSYFLEPLGVWHRLGLSILTFDYRGYGRSEGRPSEKGTYRDAEAAWNYLVEVRKIKPDRIIVLGRSLGGSIAAWLAQAKDPRLLVIESSFTSIAGVVNDLFPWIPGKALYGDTYATEKYLERVKCPVLVIHSPDDEIIPFTHGEKLYDAVRGPRQFLVVSGSHNTGFHESLSVYEPGLKEFLSTYMKKGD